MEIQQKIATLSQQYKNVNNKQYYLIESNNINGIVKKIKYRFFIHDVYGLCIYGKGRSRYGYQYKPTLSTIDVDIREKTAGSKKTEAEKWTDSWKRVVDKLNKSGLWKELKEEKELALSIGYDKIKKAYTAYWATYEGKNWEEKDQKKHEAIKNIDIRLVTDKGARTEILWHCNTPAKVKTMDFGKWRNESIRHEIKEAIASKKEYSTGRIIVKYDVSFSYNPKLNKAWYSEEYRGCGNGHYYLAISDKHALYYEDD